VSVTEDVFDCSCFLRLRGARSMTERGRRPGGDFDAVGFAGAGRVRRGEGK